MDWHPEYSLLRSTRQELVPLVGVVLLVLGLGVPHEDPGVAALDGPTVAALTPVEVLDLDRKSVV